MKYFLLFSYITLCLPINYKTKITKIITCSWKGHCLGTKCINENDCSDDLICNIGVCNFPQIKTPVKNPIKKPVKLPIKTPVKNPIKNPIKTFIKPY